MVYIELMVSNELHFTKAAEKFFIGLLINEIEYCNFNVKKHSINTLKGIIR